jgi:phospholipid/cholesterol/gamma-HCH transport system substrate-binding protein
VIALLIWLGISAYNGVPLKGYSTVYVTIAQAGNLLAHDPVRIAGVRVGQVTEKSIAPDGRIRLQLQLEPGVSLPADTVVRLRASGLLGARYVELIPGHSTRTLASGSTIAAPTAALTYGVPEALDTFDTETRGALGTMVRELGAGMLGRGTQLNAAIRNSAPQMVPFQQLAEAILANPGAAQRLLPSLDQMTTALANSRVAIASTFGPAATALAPFVDRRGSVQSTLDAAPGALTAANAGLGQGESLLDAASALADAARVTLPDAPSGLQQATALLADTHPDLQRANSLLQAAQPAVPAALRVTASLKPLLAPLLKGLQNLIPMVNQIAPYGCNIENMGAVFRSMTGFGGTGTGPHGPAMEFRLTVVPPGGLNFFGAKDTTPLTKRDGYPPPCKYLASTYPSVGPRSAGGSGGP